MSIGTKSAHRDDDLAGKAVLITGGSTGIGAEAAMAFARRGAKVAINFRSNAEAAENVAAAIKNGGGTALLLQADITDPAVPRKVVHDTVAAFDRLDVVINNAGALIQRTKIEDYTDEYLSAVVDLNASQVVRMMHHSVAQMRKQGGPASIVNVSSVAARTGGGPGSVLYAASKGFVLTATRGWARELAGEGIRVNAVSPGVILTPFHERFSDAAQLAQMKASIPMDRLGTSNECVGTLLYLASERASSYVTGQCIEVNGGQYMV